MFRLILLTLILASFSFAEVEVKTFKIKQDSILSSRIGSGLSYAKKKRKGLIFYTVRSGRFKLTSNYSEDIINLPTIVQLKTKKKKIEIEKYIPITLPLNKFPELEGKFIDLEGIAGGRNKSFWLVDEISSSILHVAKDGRLIAIYKSGDKLPDRFLTTQSNRGFEGITMFGDKVLVSLQSPLMGELDKKFIRLLEYDVKNNQSKEFYYPLDSYLSNSDAKIGGLQAIDNNKIILIEQGYTNEGYQQKVYLVAFPKKNKGNFLSKEILLDLKKYDWKFNKAEGVSLSSDGSSIAVINDPEEGEDSYLYLFKLDQSFYSWSPLDWALFTILGFIFIFCSVFIIMAMLHGRKKS